MIRIFEDLEALSVAAADLVVRESRVAAEAKRPFSLVLSGGSTPRRSYELLATAPWRDRIQWPNVHVFWGDERVVPVSDPRSNARMATEAFLDKVPIPESQVHPVYRDESARRMAEDYEAILRRFFDQRPPCFDLVLLGLGENGHTASLFPRTEVLGEHHHWVRDLFLPEQDMYRVTMTVPLLNLARRVAFLVAGEQKAQVLRDVLEGPYRPEILPAQLVHPVDGHLEWLVDAAAAARLNGNREENP